MTSPTTGPVHLVVMGVAGTGKSTIGRGLAEVFALPFAEGDDFHSDANRHKMASGEPLTDEDRWPWLQSLQDWMTEQAAQGRSTVVACSALRQAYRDVLRKAEGETFFVHLVLPEEVNLERLTLRQNHFMTDRMLGSQLATHEVLAETEHGIEALNVGDPRHVIAEISWLLEGRFGARLHG